MFPMKVLPLMPTGPTGTSAQQKLIFWFPINIALAHKVLNNSNIAGLNLLRRLELS
jgi:hypothetical protein